MTQDTDPQTSAAAAPPDRAMSRRALLWLTSRVAMIGGLAGGYGMLAWLSGRFMLPAQAGRLHQLFVARVTDVAPGDSVLFQTPDRRTVNVTRRGQTGTADDFIALSSTCPHLGCQVHWEGQNNRYFCPCHNGTFDPDGRATGGPPGDAGQWLPRYELTVEKGLLYMFVPAEQLSLGEMAALAETTTPAGPGSGSCRGCRERRAGEPTRDGSPT